MNNNYRSFFGLKKEPFRADISLNDILKTPELIDVKERFDYVIRLGAIGLVTGEVGSGKSTAIYGLVCAGAKFRYDVGLENYCRRFAHRLFDSAAQVPPACN